MTKAKNLPAVVQRTLESVLPELRELQTETDRRRQAERFRKALAGLVFAYWATKLDHPRSMLDRNRERLLMSRLHEADDNVSDLLWVVDGAFKDDWIMGRAAKTEGRRYDSIEFLFRNRGQIERLAEKCLGFREGRVHPMAAKHVPR